MYFTRLGHTNKPANALQRAARECLEKNTNRLIPDADTFVKSLADRIMLLNDWYCRCTPLRLTTNKFAETIHVYLGEHFTVDFKLYLVKDDMDDRGGPIRMKAISLWQPWASAMALGSKTVETRHWPTDVRGPLAIHAAKRCLKTELTRCWGEPEWRGALYKLGPGKPWEILPFGAIVAVGILTGCVRTERIPRATLRYQKSNGSPFSWTEEDMGDFSPGRYAWIFENIRPLNEPIPFKGKQGFFTVPDELLEVAGVQI